MILEVTEKGGAAEAHEICKRLTCGHIGSSKGVVKLPWMPAFVVFGAGVHHGFSQKAVF